MRVDPDRLPAPARRDAQRLARQLGDRVRLRAYRSRRLALAKALDTPDSFAETDNAAIYVVAFWGSLRYARARAPGGDGEVRGRFAYSTYTSDTGAPLDLGVFPKAPRRFPEPSP